MVHNNVITFLALVCLQICLSAANPEGQTVVVRSDGSPVKVHYYGHRTDPDRYYAGGRATFYESAAPPPPVHQTEVHHPPALSREVHLKPSLHEREVHHQPSVHETDVYHPIAHRKEVHGVPAPASAVTAYAAAAAIPPPPPPVSTEVHHPAVRSKEIHHLPSVHTKEVHHTPAVVEREFHHPVVHTKQVVHPPPTAHHHVVHHQPAEPILVPPPRVDSVYLPANDAVVTRSAYSAPVPVHPLSASKYSYTYSYSAPDSKYPLRDNSAYVAVNVNHKK